MWSGATSCVAAARARSAPVTVSTFEPMPWMSAPIFTSMRARSWTCGSQAALPMHRGARRQRGGHQRVLGRHDRRLVHEDVAGAQAAGGARSTMSRVELDARRRARAKASRCGSRRRRPMTSPPGGGISARPKRASSGPASRNEARMRSDELAVDVARRRRRPRRRARPRCSPRHVDASRRGASSSASIASTSRMRGHVAHDDLLLGEHGGGEDGQGGVLVAGRARPCPTAGRRLR